MATGPNRDGVADLQTLARGIAEITANKEPQIFATASSRMCPGASNQSSRLGSVGRSCGPAAAMLSFFILAGCSTHLKQHSGMEWASCFVEVLPLPLGDAFLFLGHDHRFVVW
mmetsp:Transcript_21128/g.42909  ORF Transcript_21128/g.42909 Transcript_21128/m.42909 type:complete len:113 (+) Transcript_21128:70-408(+)